MNHLSLDTAKRLLSLVALLVTCAASGAWAEDVFHDDFNGANSPLVGTIPNLGAAWTQTGTNASNALQISNGAVTLEAVGQDAYAALATPVTNMAGLGFTTRLDLTVSDAQSAGDYFLHLSDPVGTTSQFYQRLFARSAGGGYQLGLLDTSGAGSATTWGTQELSFGTNYHVDINWNFQPGATDDTFSMALEGAPYLSHTWTSALSEPAHISAINFRQGNSAITVPTVSVDNLVVYRLPAPFSIYKWEYIDPNDPSRGKQQSSTVTPDGFGLQPQPGLHALYKDLTMAYLHGADLENAELYGSKLIDADLSNANLTGANLGSVRLVGADLAGAKVRGANFENVPFNGGITFEQLSSTASFQEHDLTGINLNFSILPAANFSQVNLASAKFHRATLTDANFSQAVLTQAIFNEANLTGANFAGADVRQANFSRSDLHGPASSGITPDQLSSTSNYLAHDLSGIDFSGNRLAGASFRGQNLTNAIFSGADLTGVDFTDAIVRGAKFSPAFTDSAITLEQLYSTASYRQHDLVGIELSTNLNDVDFSNQNLSTAFLAGAFDNANFRQANLITAGLTGTFTGGDFRLANLTGAILNYADLTGANLEQANFTNAAITYANFSNTNVTLEQLYSTASYPSGDLLALGLGGNNLAGANFVGKRLGSAKFAGANLTGANLAHANANVADFTNANLTGANLTNAIFTGATFTGANLAGANIRGSQLDGQLVYEERCQGRPAAGGCIGVIILVPVGSYGGIGLPQLMATANYLDKDLSSTNLSNIFLSGADFAGFNLTRANFVGTVLTDANFSGADARGSAGLENQTSPNLIHANGHIHGLDLTAGRLLVVRDYDLVYIPIQIEQQFTAEPGGVLRLLFDSDVWDSTISFAPGIPVVRDGTLELLFANGTDLAAQVGRTFQIFDWAGVAPTGTFDVASPYQWDLSNFYTAGQVTLLAVPEPATASLALFGICAAVSFYRYRTKLT